MNNSNPIGVIDSGIGGLTVLDKLIEKMPNENFIFIGDQKNCPYGTKTNDEIKQYCKNLIEYLTKQKVKAIVIACNTASTHIDYLKTLVDIPLISVIEPTCNMALKTSKNHQIGVIATISTINNQKYQNLITTNHATCYPLACSEFVDLVEQNDLTSPFVYQKVKEVLAFFKDKPIDTLVYGCTHFSLLEDPIKQALGSLNYISSGIVTADYLFNLLKQTNNLNLTKQNGTVELYTTASSKQMEKQISWFKHYHEPIKTLIIEEKNNA